MRKYRKLGCNTIKYDGIGRLYGVASTALSLCTAWQRAACPATHLSAERTGKEAGARMKTEVQNCKLHSMNGLNMADSHSKEFPLSFVALQSIGGGVEDIVVVREAIL